MRFSEDNEIIRDETFHAVLVGIGKGTQLERDLEELEGLTEAAGGIVSGIVTQDLERVQPATYIGKGKVEELALVCDTLEADTVVVDAELSGIQLRNLEDATGMRVIDRTILILDIFAKRAVTKEGKLQVELAQLSYRLPRLLGFGKALSRQGAGIGTRGPGEKQLETDRRHIERRMADIKRELAKAEKTGDTKRAQRMRSGIPQVALVGYTNAGKSALLNHFLGKEDRDEKDVFSEDMLFATLEAEQRKYQIEGKGTVIFSDTVGFVHKLPHSLVNAFHGTLEEVRKADLLLHVVDVSREDAAFCVDVTEKVLREIGAENIPRILVLNKVDLGRDGGMQGNEEIRDAVSRSGPEEEGSASITTVIADNLTVLAEGIGVSAKTGAGIEELESAMANALFGRRIAAELRIPYQRGDVVSYLMEQVTPKSVTHEAEGTRFIADLPEDVYERVKAFVIG